MTTTKIPSPLGAAASEYDSGIDLVQEDEERVLRMWGEIDASLRARASEAVSRFFSAGGPLVIDTSKVTFMDSAGLAFLVQICMIADEEGMTVELRHPTPAVCDLLEMVGLADRLCPDGVAPLPTVA